MAKAQPAAEDATNEGAVSYRDLAPMTSRLLAYNVGYLTLVWTTVAAAATLAALHPSWWTILLAALIISGRQHALLNIEHECIHRIFVRGRKANDFVGRFFAASACGSPFVSAKATHLMHHRLLSRDGDPDHPLHGGRDKEHRDGLAKYFAFGLLGGHVLRVLTNRSEGEDLPSPTIADLASIVGVQGALFGLSWLLLDWWVYPVLWAAPLGTFTAGWHITRSYGEHAITPDEKVANGNRLISTLASPVELYFLAPYNMNYHAEHHLHPFVPAPRLPELRKRMAVDPSMPPRLTRRSYLGALAHNYRALPARR